MRNSIIYPKPLSFADRVLIDTVTARYEGIETPFMVFERDDHFELRCAPTIRTSPERLAQLRAEARHAQPITGEATSGLRLPNGAGAING